MSATTILTLSMSEIREGDTFVHEGTAHWVASDQARFFVEGGHEFAALDVQFVADGGCSTRTFNANHTLTIERAEA